MDRQWLSDKQAESPFVTVNHILIDASTCSGDVTVPNDVNYIADSAFSSCRTVTGVVIQNGVTDIGESAFAYCSMLSSISIPDSVTFISASAFSNCTSLTEIEIPDRVTTIDGRTFFNSKRAQLAKHEMEIVGKKLRDEMLWKNDTDLDSASN